MTTMQESLRVNRIFRKMIVIVKKLHSIENDIYKKCPC